MRSVTRGQQVPGVAPNELGAWGWEAPSTMGRATKSLPDCRACSNAQRPCVRHPGPQHAGMRAPRLPRSRGSIGGQVADGLQAQCDAELSEAVWLTDTHAGHRAAAVGHRRHMKASPQHREPTHNGEEASKLAKNVFGMALEPTHLKRHPSMLADLKPCFTPQPPC